MLEIVEGITFEHLFGQSRAMQELRKIVEEVAPTNIPVLITGESGTGKDLVARAIHKRSIRADKPFIKVNCVNIPAELLESELFGYEKGAFTGAYHSKPGRVEFANKGSLFLDEIGDVPLVIQGKLLRLLQEGEFSRLGSYRDIKVDIRVISATNRCLEDMVQEGKFREDLYFRINVVKLEVPPLRERKEEIPYLIKFFQKKFAAEYNKPIVKLSSHCIDLLTTYPWPGNVRELENAMKRLVILGEKAVIRELESKLESTPKPVETYDLKRIAKMAVMEAERKAIKEVLEKVKWNKKEAAKILNISYKALLYKIRELKIK
ncbi:MAG TPA: sigma-54-dependent Fis family transcriptional regulator [Candidatus Desulfofervidus auxilii]|uniref:Sigma-54-dependent Fis family transcriptional regulator n=1 Tax=Desulfofervidus auxilii TaxID=1621989 RepID=A0A7C0Y640_DESA2|nr:sigma-54 dependent transcriptional regulator [Candidatus Desulfofervidus auxilii]HDD45361.1 sigma-54-dependent Fis family transcriptional regulator [Candidatus Desulfofervidus auxilii]